MWNAYAALVLAALLVEYGVSLAADLLNLRALRPELPAEFRDTYDADRYRRSQEYTRDRTRFGILTSTLDLALLLGFWALGGFAWLDAAVRGLGLGPVVTGLLFIGALALGHALWRVPFSWYATFTIEERYGFNKTTPATFAADRVKGMLLAVLLGGPLLAAILWFFRASGDAAWLLCWGATAAFLVVVHFVAPTWILPLFNKFEPLDEGELRDAVLSYAQGVRFPLEGLFVIDGSRRSTKANAYFTGFGKRKRVALFDTLIGSHDTQELVAIVAHEIGHYKCHHVVLRLGLGIAQMGVLFFLLSLFLSQQGLFAAFGVQEPSVHAGLVFFALLYSPIDLVLSFAIQYVSRRNEFEADRFARDTTGSGERLATALKRLSADTLSNLTPHPFYVLLHHSHPPVLERIRALRAPSRSAAARA